MMKILVFGNPLVKQDSIQLDIVSSLQKEFPEIEFKVMPDSEELDDEGRDLVIIDAVAGIKEAVLIENLDSLSTEKIYSLHDFDLAYTLKLMKKMGMIDSVKILGIPQKVSKKEAVAQLKNLIYKVCFNA